MLKKKNYKQQDHYTQYYHFSLPLISGKKIIIYYKRYRPKLPSSDKVMQIYDLIHKNKNQSEQLKNIKSPYPIDRTLELMTFDEELQGKIQPILKKIGKIRKCQFGTGQHKNRQIYFCLAIFKYEFDLVKCFRDDYIQGIIQQQFKIHQNQQDKDDYRAEIIQKYLKPQLESKNKKIKQLHDEGFNLVTNKLGQFKVDKELNQKWVEELPQVKKKRKMQQMQEIKSKIKME